MRNRGESRSKSRMKNGLKYPTQRSRIVAVPRGQAKKPDIPGDGDIRGNSPTNNRGPVGVTPAKRACGPNKGR